MYYCCTPATNTHVFRGYPSIPLAWSFRGTLDNSALCSHVARPDSPSNGPCAESQNTPALTGSNPTHSVPHHMGKYPKYCTMASRRPKLELWSDVPLVGDPDRIHAQYPGDASSRPFPDCPSLATFCYPMHDVISLTTRGAKGRGP